MPRPTLPRSVLLRRSVRPNINPIIINRSFSSTPTSCSPSPSSSRQIASSSSSSSAASSSSSSSASTFSTINESEISHFSKLSSQWWDETGEFKLLHRMNPTRIEYIREKVAFDYSSEQAPEWTFENRYEIEIENEKRGQGLWLSGKSILDVGCGGGLLSESLSRLGGNVLAIDASKENINIANIHSNQDSYLKKQIKKGQLEFRHTSAEVLRDQNEKFDLVCSMEVVEHVDKPTEFLKCLGDMVKPGGHLILSTISRTPLSQLLTLTLAEDVLKLVTPGTHTYKKFIKPEELRRFVYSDMGGNEIWYKEENSNDIVKNEIGETRGIIYDPLAGSWKLWNGVQGSLWKGLGEQCNYMFHARKRL
ncbi:3-demethylubiquinone-9 3-O-methyltransferase [Kwoniella dendrophila CBS 6074]|uniref:Ubiquinone biosynthesis O-methyltransferase, mitochondrial n=1 Tax=Kwoniella dendrophila CBS 6074 TaxID=1295534 RepID=A0AAX4JQC3_9TREE